MDNWIEEGGIGLSLVVLSWNTSEITIACIDSIISNPPDVPWELIIVDNASTDGSPDDIETKYKKYAHIHLIRNDKNLGFTGGNNQAIERANGKVIGLLNSDTLVPSGALNGLYKHLIENNDVGVVGPVLTHEDGSPTTSFGYFPTAWSIFTTAFLPGWIWGNSRRALGVVPEPEWQDPMPVDYVSGASFFVKKEVIDKVGAFDAETFFAYYEEVDWCKRISEAGWNVVFIPTVKIVHLEGKSFDQLSVHRRILQYDSAKRFYRKHYSLPKLWWFQFCEVIGSLTKLVYFGIRVLLQPHRRERWRPHVRWNMTVFELWKRGLNPRKGRDK